MPKHYNFSNDNSDYNSTKNSVRKIEDVLEDWRPLWVTMSDEQKAKYLADSKTLTQGKELRDFLVEFFGGIE